VYLAKFTTKQRAITFKRTFPATCSILVEIQVPCQVLQSAPVEV